MIWEITNTCSKMFLYLRSTRFKIVQILLNVKIIVALEC